MTRKQFLERIYKEWSEKEPDRVKKVKMWNVIGIINAIICLLGIMAYGTPGLLWWILQIIILVVHNKAYGPSYHAALKKYVDTAEYVKYPVDYPHSFVYPGEPYPFSNANTATQPVYNPVQAQNAQPVYNPPTMQNAQPIYNPSKAQNAQPVYNPSTAQAPVYVPASAQNATSQAPVRTTIYCTKCGQALAVSVGKTPVQVTCPTCKNTFVHNPN